MYNQGMQMRQYRLWLAMIKVTIVLFLLIFPTAQAGLVIGGTRFAYPKISPQYLLNSKTLQTEIC